MSTTQDDAEIMRKLRLLVPVPHSNTFLNAADAIERLSAELAASKARERTVAEEKFLSLSIARYSNSLTTGVFGTGELSHSFGAWWESYKNLDAERQKKTI